MASSGTASHRRVYDHFRRDVLGRVEGRERAERRLNHRIQIVIFLLCGEAEIRILEHESCHTFTASKLNGEDDHGPSWQACMQRFK